MSKNLTIGCLALQGCVERHRPHIEALGLDFMPVKTAKHFEQVDGFILPGGESTTMLKLIDRFELWDVLAEQFKAKPVWGICAGSILIAEKVFYSSKRVGEDSQKNVQKSFGLIPMTVERNGYGRQVDSHTAKIDDYEVSLIRAPIIQDVANDVEIKASHEDDPVWVDYGQYMATTFHPELTFDFPSPMHDAFVQKVKDHG
jgi:5'-phosphate synthase pdxT subunit